jgi:1-deoxy-D-xylulose-5-phosphate reductoisomerase
MKNIAILGSTGSIGTQALDVIRAHPDKFGVEVLTANGNAGLLITQAIEFQPNAVVITDESKYTAVKEALASHPIKVFSGEQSLCAYSAGRLCRPESYYPCHPRQKAYRFGE